MTTAPLSDATKAAVLKQVRERERGGAKKQRPLA
jgi:hypothetical protein